jgi:hypothetical protein
MCGRDELSIESLSKQVFAFGSPTGGVYGHMVLRSDGTILGYRHTRESFWRVLNSGELEFLSAAGSPTCRLEAQSASVWLGKAVDSRFPVMLVSALHHDATGLPPSIIVNSIPKAGTYFFLAALARAGFPNSGLHLSGHRSVHDYRGLSLIEMHRVPNQRLLDLPVELAACITPGCSTPAHIEFGETVAAMRDNGLHVVHLKRDLRDVVISLYRFKLERVAPTDELDHTWRTFPEPERLCLFLVHFARSDLAAIRDMAKLVASESALDFEDMLAARIPVAIAAVFDAICPGLSSRLETELSNVRDHPTSTLSSARSRWQDDWTDQVQKLFVALGLEAANKLLGYD